jgi:hypothetical protein
MHLSKTSSNLDDIPMQPQLGLISILRVMEADIGYLDTSLRGSV